MVGLLASACRFIRACLPVVLVLHLAAAQAVMLPAAPAAAPAPAQAVGAAPEAQAPAMHCHDMESMAPVIATPAKPVPAHSGRHCDPGQCHCPVAMAQEARLSPEAVAFIRRIEPRLDAPGIPSLRQAPDLRPPIQP